MKKFIKIPFDIEKAKRGSKVVTRLGMPVRIICFDRVEKRNCHDYPIVGLMMTKEGDEIVTTYSIDGRITYNGNTQIDLLLLEEVEEEECLFKPFDKVLVRDTDIDKWRPALFAYYEKMSEFHYGTIIGESFTQCVPYKGNEDICMTTNKPDKL